MANQLARLTAAMELLAAAQQDCDRLRGENAELRARLNAAGAAAARLSVLTLRAAQERDALLEAARAAQVALAGAEGMHGTFCSSQSQDAPCDCWQRDRQDALTALRAALAALAQAEAP